MTRRIALAALAIALLTTGLVTTGMTVTAGEMVEIRLRGHYYAEPATVRVTVAVEPDDHNRTLRLEADGDSMFRSSEVPLAGSGAERLHTIELKNLPAGTYTLTAEVLSGNAVLATDEQELTVMGR